MGKSVIMRILTNNDIQAWIRDNQDWTFDHDNLSTLYTFKNFVEAFGFISTVAIEMERANHHATITNTYNKVHITMTTHDAGNQVTEKDTQLAETISKLKG